MCKFIPIIFVLSWIFSIFLNKITNSASYKFIPVILHFSWIFSEKSIKLVQVHSSPEYLLLKLYMLLHSINKSVKTCIEKFNSRKGTKGLKEGD